LRSHGANIVDDIAELLLPSGHDVVESCYLLIPHTTSVSDTLRIPEGGVQPTVVTELWVERCLYQKMFEDPRAHVTSTPFPSFPIAGNEYARIVYLNVLRLLLGFEALSICSTGFQGIALTHASKAVKLIGKPYQ